MFRVYNSGFSVDLDNGYTVSVQFHPFSMCSNKKFAQNYKHQMLTKKIEEIVADKWYDRSKNAEIAVIDTVTGKFMPIDNENVQGYQNVNQFLHLINEVRDYPNTDSKMDEVMGEMIPTKDKE